MVATPARVMESSAGQKWIRLSLRGYAPEWGPWLDDSRSERSGLILVSPLKASVNETSGGVPHEGGVRFRPARECGKRCMIGLPLELWSDR